MKLFCLSILLFLVFLEGLYAQSAERSRWFDATSSARGVIDNSVYGQGIGTGVNYSEIRIIPALSYQPPVEILPPYSLSILSSGAQSKTAEPIPMFYVLDLQRSVVSTPVKANFTKLEFSKTSFSRLGE